jgi:hypothetical protein
MSYDSANGNLTLVIRTGAYLITLDAHNRTVRLARIGEEPEWSISLGCDEGVWSAC